MTSFTSEYPLTTLVTLTTLFQYNAFGINVGRVRNQENFPAPKVFGNERFERAYRIQMNTLESLPIQLVALLLFAQLSGKDEVAAGLGTSYVLGRLLYAIGYTKHPKNRAIGFALSFLSQSVLLGGSLYFAVKQLGKLNQGK